jgi:hypothetical protein
MKPLRAPLALAVLAAVALPLLAMHVQATPHAARTDADNAPASSPTPDDWIMYDETSYSPVVDDVDRHLAAARAAFAVKDSKTAAAQLRTVSAELRAQSESVTGLEHERAQEETSAAAVQNNKAAALTARRMTASAAKVDAAAAAVDEGQITTTAQLDKEIDKADRADMDQRWLVSEVSTWYPVVQQPQRHFTAAAVAFAAKDYGLAAAEIRKAESYIHKESGRASGSARSDLDDAAGRLEDLARSVQTGSEQDAAVLRRAFAAANRALASEYRTLASRSWVRKEYDDAGHELRASAQSLESGADWLGAQARADASATVTETRTLGDKLSAGAGWTRDEVAKGMVNLGNGIEEMGRHINPKVAGG